MKYNQIRIELGALGTALFYASQKERINAFNRIRQVMVRKIEGKGLTEKSKKKDDKDKYKDEYNDKKLIKYIMKNMNKLPKEEQSYVQQILDLLDEAVKRENMYKTYMHNFIEKEEIYEKWLKDIKGISTLSTANLLQYFGYCEKAKHCSSLWKYAGFHVVDGAAPKKSKGEGQLDWNPKLRTLMYRIGDSFIKQRTPFYRDIYDKEKERQQKLVDEKAENAPKRKLHADLRARRKMIKRFLADYYEHCLLIRGIKPDKVYAHRND